jgi:hypothetical protein
MRRATRGQQGGVATYLLGFSCLVLILFALLGLLEGRRATLMKTQATRALEAALQSAALSDPDQAERTFDRVLRANLGEGRYQAALHTLPTGGYDPLAGAIRTQPFVTGAISLEYHLSYVGWWLPPGQIQVVHSLPLRHAFFSTGRPFSD